MSEPKQGLSRGPSDTQTYPDPDKRGDLFPGEAKRAQERSWEVPARPTPTVKPTKK